MDAKQHDMQPDTSQKLTWSSAHTKVKKRSIRRAFARACQHGLAWYRGRCYTPSDFPNGMHIAPPKIQDPQKSGAARDHIECNRRHQDSQRLRLFHWNTGGLNFSKLDEIKIWLDAQRIDAAFLTETRMTFEAEWSDANWHHVHTGQGNDRGAELYALSLQGSAPNNKSDGDRSFLDGLCICKFRADIAVLISWAATSTHRDTRPNAEMKGSTGGNN